MKLTKYDKVEANGGNTTIIGGNTTINEGNQGSGGTRGGGDRTIWGQDDEGDNDIDGSMTVHGDIHIKSITPPTYDPDDPDDDGETIEEEEGGGSLDVELDVTVGRHLFINYPSHPEHPDSAKKCVGEILGTIEKNLSDEVTRAKTSEKANADTIAAEETRAKGAESALNDAIDDLSDDLSDEITRAKKAEKQLDERVTVLEQRKQAGYYWSTGIDGDQPTEPVEYVGPDIGDFEISPEHPYLWRTTDGTTWSLAQKWIEPEPAKYYVACTHLACYVHGDNTRYYYPGGFVCFITNFVNKPFGVANWTTPVTGFQSQGATAPSLSYPSAMQSTQAGKIPNVTGYPYIFRIDDISQVNNYMKWALVQSGSSSGGTFEHVIPYDDWGSGTTAPGYLMWVVNRSNNQIADQYLGANPSTDPFITADGTSDKWNNAKWRKSFLQHILSGFLYQNRSFYNENVNGWSFSYNGVISSTGYGGQWTGRMAGVQPPTSNDPSDIGYYYAASIAYLSGYVYGRSSGCPFRVDFIFRNITLGARLPYRQLPASVGGTIDKTGTAEKVWNCDYGECVYKITNN